MRNAKASALNTYEIVYMYKEVLLTNLGRNLIMLLLMPFAVTALLISSLMQLFACLFLNLRDGSESILFNPE